MGAVFSIVFPIYCAIALGFALVKFGAFSPQDMKAIGRFVLSVAFPALIFQAVATRPLAEVFNADYMLAYVLAGLAMVAFSYLWFGMQGQDAKTRAVNVMGACCPNNGFVGYAVFLLALPDLAGVILTLNIIVENVVIVPICLMILHGAEHGGRGVSRLWQILLGVLKLPMIIGLIAGIVVALIGVQIPAPLSKVISLIAATASGLGLIVIGGALADLPKGTRILDAVQPVLGKLVLAPLLALAITTGLVSAGVVTLEPAFFAAVILSSAMPSFVILVMFAQRFDMQGQASLILFGTTLGAFVSLSLLLTLLF